MSIIVIKCNHKKVNSNKCSNMLNVTLWIVVFLVSFISWFIFYVKKKHSYWERQGIKGPKPLFLVGTTFAGVDKPIVEANRDFYKKFGNLYGLYDGLQAHLVVGDPELLRHICVKDFHIFPQGFHFPSLHEIEKSFLINLYGEKWKRIRTLLTPTFSTGKIKRMFNLMKICNKDAQLQLKNLTKSGEAQFDPKYFWGRYNMDVIAKCCFATNLDVYSNEEDVFLRNFIEFFQGNPLKLLCAAVFPGWFSRLLKLSLFPPKNLEFLRDLTLTLIENRKNGQNKADDFLQTLIDLETSTEDGDLNKAKLSTDEIVGASMISLVAGYETTSTLLTWSCYRLAKNPDIQEKLYQQISEVDLDDYETLNSLSYLDAVISETLRIDAPIVLFQRLSHSDYKFPGTNVEIKKGTTISIPVYAIHHDPANYPDPEVFDPQRFLDGSVKPFTFLPFGSGPRLCIGMRFALINAKLSLAYLVKNYHIFTTDATPSKIKYARGSIILAAEDLKLGIKPR
ncbi:cytochrome P450 3A16 [Tetranychus urticae]|uniref:Cytochrome P450 n=1 Tax=Tetranychus urticae TaxID=32264 RepID=T1KXV1_TETUR|nr:cytochrome P450 3A16 [Tetranychus urticae]